MVTDAVETKQIAPKILKALGLKQAVRHWCIVIVVIADHSLSVDLLQRVFTTELGSPSQLRLAIRKG